MCFKRKTTIRESAQRLVTSTLFQSVMVLVIIADCIHMASSPTTVDKIPLLGAMFVTIYSMEMVLKMMALGVCFHRGSYFTSAWNWLDFVLTVAGYDQYDLLYYIS